MIKNFLDTIKKAFINLDKKAFLILKHGLKFCFTLCIFSLAILLTYEFILNSIFIYDLGIAFFRISMIFAIEFVVCAIAVDSIKKQLLPK